MKLYALLCLWLIASMSGSAHAESARTGRLWGTGKDLVQAVKCPAGGDIDAVHCLAIQVRSATGTSVVGQGYTQVKVLWQGRSAKGRPDVVLLGDYGGSSGLSDLYAIGFSPALAVWKLGVAPGEAVTVDRGQPSLCIDLPFAIGGFNQAPSAAVTIVPIPVCWSSGGFALDKTALLARSYPQEDLRFRSLAIRSELRRWAQDVYPATDVYPIRTTGGTPVTAGGLADLILSGHADIARQMLHGNWPSIQGRQDISMGGEARFWAALCRGIVDNQDWQRFQLDGLPHADLVETAAKTIQN